MNAIRADLVVCRDCESVALEVAERFVCSANRAANERGVFYAVIPGGRSPQGMYLKLASPEFVGRVPWDRTHIFFADERHVPPDHADSNYKLVNRYLLSQVPIPAQNVHRIRAELPVQEAATKYEAEIRQYLRNEMKFDFVLLGVGNDAHVASLFPNSPALSETERLVAANYIEKFSDYRITLTLPVLCNARSVVMLAMWEEKAEAVHHVLQGELDVAAYPAQAVQLVDGRLIWVIEQSAAGML